MMANQSFTVNIKALFDASDVKAKVSDIQNAFKNIKLPDNLQKSFTSSFDNLNKALTDFETRATKGIKTKADAKGLTGSMDNVIKEFTKVQTVVDKIRSELGTSIDLGKAIKLDDATLNKLNNLKQQIADIQKQLSNVNTSKLSSLQAALNEIKSGSGASKQGQAALELFKAGDVQGAIDVLDKIIAKLETYKQTAQDAGKDTTNVANSIKQLDTMRTTMQGAQNESAGLIADQNAAAAESAQILADAQAKVVNQVDQAANSLSNYGNQARSVGSDVSNMANNQARLNTELDQVKSRIQYFFGLSNAINLVRRAVRGAVETVKELDAAMTETAVVTNYTVKDMWDQLPEYTKRANELGVMTKDAYESATLYFQQGLNADQAAALSTETLKMARIAGLDAAEATDRMTNALRGFNMELDTASAQRVDDVYSELAAISASDVDEISTAMTKVASLAHSANMEFETTAAFLAQIIETTRESAETAGTALKTVVARFSEVKKLYDMDELKGKDEEGQTVDVNKVSQALRTAGIDLNKYFLGEVGLDDIFMELASKWDSLTSVQQRYIATQAAGSRQQSRFIALMQDYARTQELVGAAYNAEGASARQFEKTQDSLQSKLARLKNAWNEFLMGITNSSVIKGVVDVLTTLLNIINKITGAFGPATSGFLKFGVAAATIFAGKKAFSNGGLAERILGSLGNTPLGTFLGLGGNTSNQVTSAGVAFHGEVVSAGAEFAAAVRGAAGVEAATGSTDAGSSLRLTPWQAIQQFKTNSIDPRQVAYNEQLAKAWAASPAGRIGQATGQSAPQVALTTPKTLFGALGNKFYGTKLGGIARSGLAKLGIAGGNAAAVSGAAALAATIGTITAAAAAAGVAIKAMYDASPQGQLKIAQKYADTMSKTAASVQKNASELQKASRQVKEYDTAVQKATTNSERNQAIQDRNNYIESLLEQNSKYAEYLTTTFENGQMVLKLDIDASALDKAIQGANMAQAGSDLAQASVANRQANILRARLRDVDLANRQMYSGTGENRQLIHMNDAQVAEYTRYQSQLQQYESQFNAYAQKAFSELIPTDKVSDDVAQLMSQALAEGFDDVKMPNSTGWWRSRAHWQNEYLNAYGTEADTNMETADIYRAVIQRQNAQQEADRAEQLTGLLTGASKDAYQALLEGFTGQGKIARSNLLFTDISDTNQGEIYKLLGLTDLNADVVVNQLEELADALGITTKELVTGIKKRAEAEKKAQQITAFNTSSNMLQAGVGPTNLVRYLRLDDVESQEIFNNLFSSFDPSFLSDELVGSLLDGIQDADSGLKDWLNNINLSNPIQSFNKLTDAAKNGTGTIQTTAQALLDAGKASGQFSASAQLGYFTTSESFESLSEQLDKFIEENGKITASNIKELADANADLNGLLENSITSATGLANILTEIQNGTINVWDLTDAIIDATNAMDDLDGVVAQTINDLNNFDPGYDENDVSKFINKVLDNATENIGKGATGNNQMRNYMEYIFGDFDKEFEKGLLGTDYSAAYESWLNDRVAWLEANKDNMFSAWSDFAETLTNQELKLFDDQGNVIHEAAKVWQEGEEIFIEANGMTTDQLIQAMVQTGKMTEQQARMMITDFKNYSSDFAHEMAMNDLPNAVQAWMDAVQARSGGLYDSSELDTLAKLLHVKRPEIETEIEALKKDSEDFKAITFTNNKGERTRESVSGAWDQLGIEKQDRWVVDEVKKTDKLVTDVFDYDAIRQSYQDLGIPELFKQDFDTVLKEGDHFTAQLFGKQTEVSIKEGQTAGEAYADAYQQAVNQDLADKLTSAIGEGLKELLGEDNEYSININNEDGISKLEVIIDKAKETGEAVDDVSTHTAKPEGDASGLSSLSSALAGIIGQINTINTTPVSPQPGSYGLGMMATGGVVKSYARGSENFHVSPGTALTGEEGPELIWNKNKGYAYITGEKHPEFQDLQPGDRIFNAQETKKILGGAATDGKVPSFARGYGGATTTKKTSGGGSSGGSGKGSSSKDKTPEEWKNDLDWLYNLMEDIAELERDQKAIEEQYEDYLSDQTKTGGDLYRLLVKQLGNLYTQLNHQTFALEKREQEMREFMDITNDQDQYLWYNWQDRTLEIDWDAIDQITDEEQYKHVKELIDEAEEIQDKIDDADDSIMDITNQIQELENIWRDTFIDFEDRVLDAIIKSYQQIIDNYSELNDTLNNSNTQILDSLQKQISLERQIRDNTKTEEEISDEEARLAYLRRDTSGGNELAALQLERELADQRESYEDTLVDQAISRLQEDNDAAAQQRERQIEIMQAQLDYQSENGEFNAYISELLTAAMGADGELLTNSDLVTLLKEQENWDAMSAVSKQVWDEELNGTFKEVAAFLLKQNAEENGTYYTALTAAVESVSSAIGSYSQAMVKLGNTISSIGSSGGYSGGYSGGGSGGSSSGDKPPQSKGSGITAGQAGWNDTARMISSLQKAGKLSGKYATGGLADSTGLAWLDGTAQEPEYVLNARQTDAFLKLADVLPSMMNSTSTTTSNTFGATYVNLSVNLESVSPDYDVDRMVDLVKDRLYDAGSYRNVNSLSFLR